MVLAAAGALAIAAFGVAATSAALVVAGVGLAEDQPVGGIELSIGGATHREGVVVANGFFSDDNFPLKGATMISLAVGVIDILELDRLAVDRGEVEGSGHGLFRRVNVRTQYTIYARTQIPHGTTKETRRRTAHDRVAIPDSGHGGRAFGVGRRSRTRADQ